ncbi:phenylalanine--tRNA ligase subunit beta [Candidatus Woesearchaeota archaeon]|nr:phenylalanine--tRNA ligase subunit beta [Candidatus Woesearchaeota archaeon]
MPTIDISLKDLSTLLGKPITAEELEQEALLWVKGEIDGEEGDILKIDCKETNRPDLWSTEGMARALKPFFTKERGIKKYETERSGVYIHVDRSVDEVRPYITSAIIKNITITEELLKQMIQLQEKMTMTFGRKRKMLGLGLYDFDKMTPPLTYKAVKPTEAKFIPLGFTKEMTLKEVLERHPKGIEYAHLLKEYDKYPIIIDKNNVIASFPPIINSEATGKVTKETKNLFLEVTATDLEAAKVAINILSSALADRGGKIETVEIDYGKEKIITPDFTPKKAKVKFTDIERLTGMKFSLKELKELVERFGYNVKKAKDSLELEYPSYRQDILHPVDIIEDILISYGYNNIDPVIPNIPTIGELAEFEIFCESIRNVLPGFGAQETLNFTLTNKEILFDKMNIKDYDCVEIANPISSKWSCIRSFILPSLLEFFEKNNTQEYPQQVYELGEVVIIDEKAETKTQTLKHLSWMLADKGANFTKAKQMVDYLLKGLNLEYEMKEEKNPSFIEGRCAQILMNGKKYGVLGEIHPQVLKNFSLDFPTCAFEMNINELFKLKQKL